MARIESFLDPFLVVEDGELLAVEAGQATKCALLSARPTTCRVDGAGGMGVGPEAGHDSSLSRCALHRIMLIAPTTQPSRNLRIAAPVGMGAIAPVAADAVGPGDLVAVRGVRGGELAARLGWEGVLDGVGRGFNLVAHGSVVPSICTKVTPE
jgi:hypothetical protein